METRTVMTLIVIIGAMAVILTQLIAIEWMKGIIKKKDELIEKYNSFTDEIMERKRSLVEEYRQIIVTDRRIIRWKDDDIRKLKSDNERQKQYIQMLERDYKKSEEYSESAHRALTLSEEDDLTLDYEEYVADHADEIIMRSMGIEL